MAELQSTEMHTEPSANPPNVGHVTVMERPTWVPEKFHDPKTGVINFEALAKSYGELERSKSAAPEPKSETPAPKTETPAPGTETKAPIEEIKYSVPGVAPEALKSYSEELTTGGKLSEKSYADLKTAGYDKAMVDAYIRGLTVDSVVTESVQAARVADAQINEITDSIGGKEALKEMQVWATNGGMTDAQLAAYNAAVSSSDVETVRLAVAGLKHSFVSANGTGENLLSGRNAGEEAGDVFESRQEATAAINDPRYKTDSAFRAKVAAKLGRSKVI